MATQLSLINTYGNEAKVYFTMRELGYSHTATCAVMGNIYQESNFKTDSLSYDGMGSIGICQWTGSRKTNLKNFAKQRGMSYTDIICQVKFLDYELRNSEKKSFEVLCGNYTVSVMTELFEKKFERAGVPRMERRVKAANTYYVRYSEFAGTISSALGLEGVLDTIGAAAGIVADEISGFIDFNTTTQKLSSSDNYLYIEQEEKEKPSYVDKTFLQTIKDQLNNITRTTSSVEHVLAHDEVVAKHLSLPKTKIKPNTFGKYVGGSRLPIYSTIVEAPFVEVTIGDVTFGVSKDGQQVNYVQSVEVTKTNGTLNEYVIKLIHQISPGDNPNYIASLLSANGYNTLRISYGDAADGKYFKDSEALITKVSTSFDFSNCNIQYTISCSSLVYLTTSTKLNFPAKTAKPSSVMYDLLEDKTLNICEYFTGMSNIDKVKNNNLIPTTDAEVYIQAKSDKTIVEYLSYLTSLMVNKNKDLAQKTSYYFVINDEQYSDIGNTFSVKEIVSDNLAVNELVYEVDLGFPDPNMVFDFSVTSNYAWATALNTNSNTTTYKYDLDNTGNLIQEKYNNKLPSTVSKSDFNINNNTWKQLTRFPLTANLKVKGLVAPILLLTYVRVNNYFFGNKRITSGLYIVTSQVDTISGDGCRTTLGLTRVASDVESITIDGRVIT